MLAMPNALSEDGIVIGCVDIFLSGCASAFGLYLLTRCAQRIGRSSSFSALSQVTYPSLAVVFDVAIALKCFGVSLSYLIIIGALSPKVVLSFAEKGRDVPDILLDRKSWITIAILILTPIVFLRTLNALRYTSYVALVAVAQLIFVGAFLL